MNTITIPKNEISRKDIITVPFEEYERLLASSLPKKEVVLSLSQKKRLQSAQDNISAGECLTFNELRKKYD